MFSSLDNIKASFKDSEAATPHIAVEGEIEWLKGQRKKLSKKRKTQKSILSEALDMRARAVKERTQSAEAEKVAHKERQTDATAAALGAEIARLLDEVRSTGLEDSMGEYGFLTGARSVNVYRDHDKTGKNPRLIKNNAKAIYKSAKAGLKSKRLELEEYLKEKTFSSFGEEAADSLINRTKQKIEDLTLDIDYVKSWETSVIN